MRREQVERDGRASGRVGPAIVLAALLVVLTGCTEEDAEPANDLDESRRVALVEAIWLLPTGSSPGGPAITGPDRPYQRPWLSWYDDRPGTPLDVMRDHVSRARAAGWVPIFGLCEALREDETDEGELVVSAGEITVHLARVLDDGSPAYAELFADREPARRAALAVDAYALYHLDTEPIPPFAEVHVESLVCLGNPDGPESLGEEMPIGPIGYMDPQSWE